MVCWLALSTKKVGGSSPILASVGFSGFVNKVNGLSVVVFYSVHRTILKF